MGFIRNPLYASFELTEDQRRELMRWQKKARLIPSEHVAYLTSLSGGTKYEINDPATVIAQYTPEALITLLEDGQLSVCGKKKDLIWDRRRFEDGTEIDCVAFAVLGIYDSPVHFHRETPEVYTVIQGSGWLVLNDEVIEMKAGQSQEIPVNTEHGFFAKGEPAIITIQFLPNGLAPLPPPSEWVGTATFRDEEITHLFASERLRQLFP